MAFAYHIVNAGTSILFSINNTNQPGTYFGYSENVLVHRNSDKSGKVTRPSGHPSYLQRNTEIVSQFTFLKLKL